VNTVNESGTPPIPEREPRKAEGAVVEEVILEEIVEIEEYGKSGRHPPRAKAYRIRVDKEHFVFHKDEVTGREILQEAKRLPPEKYVLREIFVHGGPEKIELDQIVHLRRHGVEKFRTMLKTAQDGQ